MLTIETLKEYGADVETGLQRCINKESLYLRLVATVPGNDNFNKLKDAIANKDFENGFQAAHGLKGSLGNLALTPLYNPISEITEHLRNKEDIDYSSLLEEILRQRDILAGIC